MQQGDAADHGPAHPRLLGHVAQSGDDLLLIGLVLELVDPGSALGMVSRCRRRGPGRRSRGAPPRRGLGDRERRCGQADPGVASAARPASLLGLSIVFMLRGPRPVGAVSGQPPRVILRGVPFDDDAEADFFRFRPPPHPDDRLWRHPSDGAAAGRGRWRP